MLYFQILYFIIFSYISDISDFQSHCLSDAAIYDFRVILFFSRHYDIAFYLFSAIYRFSLAEIDVFFHFTLFIIMLLTFSSPPPLSHATDFLLRFHFRRLIISPRLLFRYAD